MVVVARSQVSWQRGLRLLRIRSRRAWCVHCLLPTHIALASKSPANKHAAHKQRFSRCVSATTRSKALRFEAADSDDEPCAVCVEIKKQRNRKQNEKRLLNAVLDTHVCFVLIGPSAGSFRPPRHIGMAFSATQHTTRAGKIRGPLKRNKTHTVPAQAAGTRPLHFSLSHFHNTSHSTHDAHL